MEMDKISSVQFQCFDFDEGGDETDDMIGQCSLPLGEVIDAERETAGEVWRWSGWRTVRESSGELAAELEVAEKDLVERGDMPPDIPYHVAMASDLADKSKAGLEVTKLAASKSKERGKAAVAKAKGKNQNRKMTDTTTMMDESADGPATQNPLAVGAAAASGGGLSFEVEGGSPLAAVAAADVADAAAGDEV